MAKNCFAIINLGLREKGDFSSFLVAWNTLKWIIQFYLFSSTQLENDHNVALRFLDEYKKNCITTSLFNNSCLKYFEKMPKTILSRVQGCVPLYLSD